jgi:hypothetical protein
LNNCFRILMGGLMLLALCRPGAAQTFYGSTGLLVHPSAFVSAPGSLHLNVTALTQKKGRNLDTYVPTSLAYGLTRRAEIGALYVRHTGPEESPHGHFGGFAKYQLVPDGASHPAFALAGTYRNGDALESFAAGVVSHNFQRNGRTLLTAHAGVKWGRTSHARGWQTDIGEFIGLEYPFAPRLRLVGETSTRFKFEHNAASALGLAWDAPNGSHVALGFVNIGRSDAPRFFFGVGYPIGGRR